MVAASRKSNISNQKLYYKVCDKFSFLKINSLLYSVIIRFRSNMCHSKCAAVILFWEETEKAIL